MAADGLSFDFEADIETPQLLTQGRSQGISAASAGFIDLPAAAIGQQPGNFRKNFQKTVCSFWLRGLCMKGDQCSFLHELASDRMPVCPDLRKFGECRNQFCQFKHSLDDIKECNMYKLGFCIYGPKCVFRHVKAAGPPPTPEQLEACKPRGHRDVNIVMNQANPGTATMDERPAKKSRPFPDRGGKGPLALPAPPKRQHGEGRHEGPQQGRPPLRLAGAERRHDDWGGAGGGGNVNDGPPDMPPLIAQPQPSRGAPLPAMAGLLQPMPNIMPPVGLPQGMPPMAPGHSMPPLRPPGGMPPLGPGHGMPPLGPGHGMPPIGGAPPSMPPFNPAMMAAMAGHGFGQFPQPF